MEFKREDIKGRGLEVEYFYRIRFILTFFHNYHLLIKFTIRRRGVVGRVPAFQPGAVARVRFPARSGILISVLGLGVCPLSVFCPLLFPAKALTLC